MEKKHYFHDPKRAARYDRDRPSFHAQALEAFHGLSPELMYQSALDIGCGTGQSSLALTSWAKKVEAIDHSGAMLDHAVSHKNIHYQLAEAEALPFDEGTSDLVFVASSLHWFQRRKFLKEVGRVLRPGGLFLIYQSSIGSGLTPHFYTEFNRRYPPPYREQELTSEELSLFHLGEKEVFNFAFPSTLDEEGAVRYFEGLSHIGAKLEEGMSEEEIRKDLSELVKTHSLKQAFGFNVQLISIKKEG